MHVKSLLNFISMENSGKNSYEEGLNPCVATHPIKSHFDAIFLKLVS
jgi:hypothetical protein